MSESRAIVVILSLLAVVNSHVIKEGLHPVQGIFVKPSTDGITGDLYVAASEDNGASKWVADQPINFLPNQPMVGYPSSTIPQEDTTQNRAVLTAPVGYTYPEGSSPYPYQTDAKAQQYPYDYSKLVYQYYYPYIMSAAVATAANALKEVGLSEEMTNAILSHTSLYAAQGYAAQYGYDPNAWARQAQATTPASPIKDTPEQ